VLGLPVSFRPPFLAFELQAITSHFPKAIHRMTSNGSALLDPFCVGIDSAPNLVPRFFRFVASLGRQDVRIGAQADSVVSDACGAENKKPAILKGITGFGGTAGCC
jgi:hypothetical protein